MSKSRQQPGRGQEGVPRALKLLLLLTLAWVGGGSAWLALRDEEPDASAPPSMTTQAPATTQATQATVPPVTPVTPVKEPPPPPEKLSDEDYRLRVERRAEETATRVEGIKAEEAGIAAFASLAAELAAERAALASSLPESLASKEQALAVIDALSCFAARERLRLEAELRGDDSEEVRNAEVSQSCRREAVGILEDWPDN